MEFGFVPAQVVKDLEEIGNWKVCTYIWVDTVLLLGRQNIYVNRGRPLDRNIIGDL